MGNDTRISLAKMAQIDVKATDEEVDLKPFSRGMDEMRFKTVIDSSSGENKRDPYAIKVDYVRYPGLWLRRTFRSADMCHARSILLANKCWPLRLWLSYRAKGFPDPDPAAA